jgi:hypothetical protein
MITSKKLTKTRAWKENGLYVVLFILSLIVLSTVTSCQSVKEGMGEFKHSTHTKTPASSKHIVSLKAS